jgi:hypothetical protein
MMSEKIACTACGVLILRSTAAENGGLCIPCKRGNRRNIEDGKLRNAERKKAAANPDPATRHWRWLVNQVYRTDDGFAALSTENQLYFAAVQLEGEVYNGGFEQYFRNSSGDYYASAVEGLEQIGAAECRRTLLAAKQVLFGSRDVPADRAYRWDQMEKMTPAREMKLDELSRLFVDEAARCRDHVAQYAREHGLFEA